MHIPMAMPPPPTSHLNYPSFSRLGLCSFCLIDDDQLGFLDTSGLQARIVKPATRARLLGAWHSMSLSSPISNFSSSTADGIDSSTLLADLTRLAPSAAKDFMQKDHAAESMVFRLINDIEFTGEEQSYIAMSYCWKKSRESPRKMVSPVGDLPFGWVREVEQFPLPTSEVMWKAVLGERQGGEGLWFDHVCINQDDEVERAIAIGAMDTIFKNARTVVVALDDIMVTEDEMIWLQNYIDQALYTELGPTQQPNHGMNPPFMHQHVLFKNFCERVLSSVWFERAWCAHEMRMGRNHVFLVPCHSAYEDETHAVLRFTGTFFYHMLILASEAIILVPALQARLRSLAEVFSKQASTSSHAAFAVRSPSTPSPSTTPSIRFVPTISEIFRMKAGGNPRLPEYLRLLDANRDKTSIALNSSGLPLALKPSSPLQRPNIEDECLRQLLLVGIAARNPVALCTTGTPLQLHDGSISWLCRPTALDCGATSVWQHVPAQFEKRGNEITQGSDGRAEYVQLDLVFLDLPHRSQPNPNFPSYLSRARSFIDLCIQHQVRSYAMWNCWQTAGHTRASAMRNIFVQTLACVFECGPQWMLELSTRLQTINTPSTMVMPDLNQHTADMLLNPHLLTQNYILIPEGRTAFTALLNLLCMLITYGIPWASGATEQTHGPLIVSSQTSSSPSSSSSSYASPSSTSSPQDPQSMNPHSPTYGGKALIFAPFEHSKTLLVAVPNAVKSTEFEGLARAWVLTSMNPFTGSAARSTVCWTLQSKSVVFGDGMFGAGLALDQGTRFHRVYGPGV